MDKGAKGWIGEWSQLRRDELMNGSEKRNGLVDGVRGMRKGEYNNRYWDMFGGGNGSRER